MEGLEQQLLPMKEPSVLEVDTDDDDDDDDDDNNDVRHNALPTDLSSSSFSLTPQSLREVCNLEHVENAEKGWRVMRLGPSGLEPLPQTVSYEHVRKEATARSANIFRDFDFLKDVLARHEATIHSRWMKKAKNQRRNIILEAWNGPMPAMHRPDFAAFRIDSQQDRNSLTIYRDSYIWPYVNQEDLCKSKTLLLFLNARGRTPPTAFAAADAEAMRLGLVTGKIKPHYLNNYTMILNGCRSPAKYGQLINCADDPDALYLCLSRKQMMPGHGLLVLEAQERVLNFLAACVRQILHEMPTHSVMKYPLLEEPSLATSSSNGFPSLPVMAAEAPYRPPAQLSFASIQSLVAARRDAAEDHLWHLREDPSYFADTVFSVYEHRLELLDDGTGSAHPMLRRPPEEILWSLAIKSEMASAHIMFTAWSELQSQSTSLKLMQECHYPSPDSAQDLPEEFMIAILTFRYSLERLAERLRGEMNNAFAASPPSRDPIKFKRVRDPDFDLPETQTGMTRAERIGDAGAQVCWLMQALAGAYGKLPNLPMTVLVDELQRLIDSNAEARSWISTYTASLLADLSLVSECIRQLEVFQPWASQYDLFFNAAKSRILAHFKTCTEDARCIKNALLKVDPLLARLGCPKGGKFLYPADKRRSRENLAIMRASESNLDRLWRIVDERLRRNLPDLESNCLAKFLTRPLNLKRTPEWADITAQAGRRTAPRLDPDTLSKPLSELHFDLETRTEATLEAEKPAQAKAKRKTRGQPRADVAPDNVLAPAPPAQDVALPVFDLDGRALKVFRTLFHTPSAGATPGQVAWTDFLHAMVSTGFAPEKLYGSVWQFRPSTLKVERSIQFHEPHPIAKLSFHDARRYGRRLNRAYGWHGGMFVLAEEKTVKKKGFESQ